MKPDSQVFRVVRWQVQVAAALALGCVAALAVLDFEQVGAVEIAAYSVLTAFAVAVLAHTLTTRVAIQADGLLIVANFRRRLLRRTAIETVECERGSGVSVRLVGGAWVKLPETGHSNDIRTDAIMAWLKGTCAASSSARRGADA